MSEAVPVLSPEEAAEITQTGIVKLGAFNKDAIRRFANIAQSFQKQGIRPASPFISMAADRILGTVTKADFLMMISGARGTGKSYSALSIASSLANEMSRRTGQPPETYFKLENCCVLEDSEGVMEILQRAKPNQILIIDDTSIQYNSRSFMEKKSKNFSNLITTMRTMRWGLIFTSPLRSMVDVNIRNMVQYYGIIYKSFHAGGWNCLKVYSVDIDERSKNEMFNRRLSFADRKIDFYCCFAPDKKMADEYDKQRDLSARRILAAGGDMTKKTVKPQSKYDRNREIMNEIKKAGGKPVFTQIAEKYGVERRTIKRIFDKMNEGAN